MKVGDRVQRAMLGVVHAVIFSDGEIRDSELKWIMLVARKQISFRNLSDEEFAMTCAAVLEEWNSAPLKVVMNRWIEALAGFNALKGEAFALAVDAVLADSDIADIEEEMLLYLARAWNISDQERKWEYKAAIERKAKRTAEG